MTAARRLMTQRHLAMLICAAALFLKLLVPAGYMIGNDHGRATFEPCSGFASGPMVMTAMHGSMADHGKDHGKTETPCAFSVLSAASLVAVEPIQLATLVAFIMAVGLIHAVLPSTVRTIYLRPPLRGPPATL